MEQRHGGSIRCQRVALKTAEIWEKNSAWQAKLPVSQGSILSKVDPQTEETGDGFQVNPSYQVGRRDG